MAQDHDVDFLTLAQSGFTASDDVTNNFKHQGAYLDFFCSAMRTSPVSSLSAQVFSRTPHFEPSLNQTKVLPEPPAKEISKKLPEEFDDDSQHWTHYATSEDFIDFSVARTWETLPPLKSDLNIDQSSKLWISEAPGSTHHLWSLAVDKLTLVGDLDSRSCTAEIIAKDSLLRDLRYLMTGMESSVFWFDAETGSFSWRRNITVDSVTPEVLQSYVDQFIQMGNMCRRLESISQNDANSNRGQTYLGLVSGLKTFLSLYRLTAFQVTKDCDLLEMSYVVQRLRLQIQFVDHLFEASLPEGIPLLVYLCDRSLSLNGTDLQHLSISLFQAAVRPFFRFLKLWAFEGKVEDQFSEFGLIFSHSDLADRTRRFWTHAFSHVSLHEKEKYFGFFFQLLPMIVTCGKTINFLKLYHPTSSMHKFDYENSLGDIQLILNPEQEALVRKKYLQYYTDHKSNPGQNAGDGNKSFDEGTAHQELESKCEHPVSKYPVDFNIDANQVTDILAKVRRKNVSDLNVRPNFSPLIILLEKSVLIPLRAHYHVLSTKGSNFILHEAKLLGHLKALRRYLFLSDTEFCRSFCSALSTEMKKNPDSKWGPGQLNLIIMNSIASSPFASKDPLAANVSFYVKGNLGETVRNSTLKLSYKSDWPVNIILTEEILTSYSEVFNFLLLIYKCSWGLQQAFTSIKSRRDFGDYQTKLLQLTRHEMAHFILQLETYVKSIIIQQSWVILKADFANKGKTIDAIYDLHLKYVNRIVFRCFLNKKAEPVKNILTEMLTNVLTFCDQVEKLQLERKSLESTRKKFTDLKEFFVSVMWKLSDRGYQQHLQDFLFQLSSD